MVDTNSLKSAIAKKGYTQSEVAQKIGISTQSLNYKLLNKTEFKVDEAYRLCDVLEIPKESMSDIFFAQKID